MKGKLPIVFVVVSALTLATSFLIFYEPEGPLGPDYVKVKGYNHVGSNEVTCTAIIPECGVCFGEVLEEECWVNPDELNAGEKSVMGVN